MAYVKQDGRKVIRLKDNKLIGKGYCRKHTKQIVSLFNVWNTLGWPYVPEDER